MHVCFLLHHSYPADTSTATNEYTRHLAANGIDVTVIAGRESPETPAHEEVNGVAVHRIETDLSTSVSPEPTIFGYRALRLLDRLSSTTDIDVLHLRGFPNLGLVLRPLPWLAAPDTVVSDIRGTAVSNAFFEALSRWGIRFQDHLVDETVVVDERVAQHIFPSDRRVSILPLGADLQRFNPSGPTADRSEWGYSPTDTVVGYTGNLHTSRELSDLIDAFADAHERESALKLVVVGDGPDRTTLEQRVETRHVTDAVTFTGTVPFEDVPQYVRAFDIGAAFIPDKPQYRNQPPLKTVEYLATGLPVAATNTPGNRRFVTHDENATVTAPNADAYADALVELATDKEYRDRLSERARDSVAEYDYERIVTDRLIPLYERVQSA